MTVVIEALEEGSGVQIDDRIQRRRSAVYTPDEVRPVPVRVDRFDQPVDTAAAIETTELTFPQFRPAYVRDADGDFVAKVEPDMEQTFDDGPYTVDLSGPMKLYLRADGPMRVAATAIQTTVSFEAADRVEVGARSYHERPATTITTTADPHDVMAAISCLGSGLKTTTHERSYPTLRGHPPAIELGDELDIPDNVEAPDCGVRIKVPASLANAFVVAPLAYYLSAPVVPGERPRIVTDSGFEHELDGPRGFEREVERVLKQTFLLDCLTRAEETDGLELFEHGVLKEHLDLDLRDLSDASPADRLEAYLDQPYEPLEEYVPEWKLTTHVSPTPESVETVPFLVDDLAVIRTPARDEPAQAESVAASIDAFMRASGDPTESDGATDDPGDASDAAGADAGTPTDPADVADDPVGTDGGVRGASVDRRAPSVVQPEPVDSIEQVWVGDRVPVGAGKAIPEAFKNRLVREESAGDIEIVVVCNDPEMLDEHDSVREVYGSRDELPFDVTFYDDLDAERLALVLESDVDFLHYIGHIDDDGFQCADGMLDVSTLDGVGVDAFFLNACHSYRQGVELIRAGAVGGVVTLDDVINSGALRVGQAMARLLNRGFPLRAALTIAAERSIIGGQYIVVGDGNLDIAHAESLIPNVLTVSSLGDDYELRIMTFPVGNVGMGTMWRPNVADNAEYYLVASRHMVFRVSPEALREFLDLEVAPTWFDGEFTWSDEVVLD